MKTIRILAAIFAAILGSLVVADRVEATVVATFAASNYTPVVGELVAFDAAGSSCTVPPCSYTWQWTFTRSGGGQQTGGQMGSGPVISYRFDAFAASKPYITVVLKVTESNSTHNWRAVAQYLKVLPAPPASEG